MQNAIHTKEFGRTHKTLMFWIMDSSKDKCMYIGDVANIGICIRINLGICIRILINQYVANVVADV